MKNLITIFAMLTICLVAFGNRDTHSPIVQDNCHVQCDIDQLDFDAQALNIQPDIQISPEANGDFNFPFYLSPELSVNADACRLENSESKLDALNFELETYPEVFASKSKIPTNSINVRSNQSKTEKTKSKILTHSHGGMGNDNAPKIL